MGGNTAPSIHCSSAGTRLGRPHRAPLLERGVCDHHTPHFVRAVERQLTGRARMLPAESKTVASPWKVPPGVVMVTEPATFKRTAATVARRGACTTTSATALWPSLIAQARPVPGVSAPTIPVGETEMMVRVESLHVMARPVSRCPAESVVVATSCTLLPTVSVSTAGVIVMKRTGTGTTVTAAVPTTPFAAVAVTVPVPTLRALTSPVAVTATAPLAPHVTAPGTTAPAEFVRVAERCTLEPTSKRTWLSEIGTVVTVVFV